MTFDYAIVQAWHFPAMLAMFVITYTILHAIIIKKPLAWRVYATGKPIYYSGWILALLMTAVSATVIRDIQLFIGLAGSAVMIILIGRLDEERTMSAGKQLFWQMLIALWAVWWGWSIIHITNPFADGVITIPGILGSIGAFIWFMMLMNAMNFLDGTDGLSSLVAIIALIALAAISLLPATQDATTLTLSLTSLGILGAFFVWNAPPARMYLGTAGSWFIGMMLAMIAIIGGGKMATVFIVLAIPLVDALVVIIHRITSGHAPWVGDKRHVHHRLASAGVGQWGILFLAALCTAALGYVGVAASTTMKIIVLVCAAIIFAVTRFRTMNV